MPAYPAPPTTLVLRRLWVPATLMLTVLAQLSFWCSSDVLAQSGGEGTPKWSRRVALSDGRTFISDGAIALDASFVKPAGIEAMTTVPGAAIEKYFQAPFTSEIRVSNLTERGHQYVTPDGIPLSRLYIEYVRRSVGSRLRLRITGERQPIVLVLDGRAVGIVMPMAK